MSTVRLALLSAFLALPCSGCCTDLNRDYVDAVEATRLAIEADVTAGFYKPDEKSRAMLDGFKQINEEADAVLKADGK